MNKISKKFVLYGLVQGVGYRYFAYRTAEKYGIVGYAKNIIDGTVEIVAEGSNEQLEQFKKEIISGPSRSRLSKITEEEFTNDKEFHTFDVF